MGTNYGKTKKSGSRIIISINRKWWISRRPWYVNRIGTKGRIDSCRRLNYPRYGKPQCIILNKIISRHRHSKLDERICWCRKPIFIFIWDFTKDGNRIWGTVNFTDLDKCSCEWRWNSGNNRRIIGSHICWALSSQRTGKAIFHLIWA